LAIRGHDTLAAQLSSQGRAVYAIDLVPNDGSVGLDVLAMQLSDYVNTVLGKIVPFDLVGFSMGGSLGRYYVQRLGGVARVDRLVTLSSPHRGTWLAYALDRVGCWQMRPQSKFLLELERDTQEILGQLNFTSI